MRNTPDKSSVDKRAQKRVGKATDARVVNKYIRKRWTRNVELFGKIVLVTKSIISRGARMCTQWVRM